MKTRLDRSERDFHGFRDLSEAQIVNESQQERFSVLFRKMSESCGKFASPSLAGLEGFKGFEKILFGRRGLISRRLSPGSDREVLYRRVQKGFQIRSEHKTRELLEKIEEGFLQHVEREILVPGKAVGETRYPFAITPVQYLKRSRVTPVDSGNEVEVALGIALQALSPGLRLDKTALSGSSIPHV